VKAEVALLAKDIFYDVSFHPDDASTLLKNTVSVRFGGMIHC